MSCHSRMFLAGISSILINWMPDKSTVCISLNHNVTVQAFGHDNSYKNVILTKVSGSKKKFKPRIHQKYGGLKGSLITQIHH